jgi:hypothetical protein
MPHHLHTSVVLFAACFLFMPVASPVSSRKPTHPAKPANIAKQFVIDTNRPFVYLQFEHVGQSDSKCYDEPTDRVWLRLVNNSAVPIRIMASGAPEDCPYDEVRIMYEVIPDRESLVIAEGASVPVPPLSFPATSAPEQELPAIDSSDRLDSEEMPGGYMFDVGSEIRILPGKSIRVSFPVNSLGRRRQHGKNWHVEIPFKFDLPQGKGPRDPVVGGEPLMVIVYSVWDLPEMNEKIVPK